MNKTFAIILAASAMIFGSTAYAGVYVTGQVTYNDWDVDGFSTIDSTYGGGAGVGIDFNDWLAVEGTFDHFGSDIQNGLKYRAQSGTAWVVVDPTIADIGGMPLKLTARAGVARTKISTGFGKETDNQPAYGAGVALGVSENMDVIVDFRRRTFDDNGSTITFKTANVGVKYSF